MLHARLKAHLRRRQLEAEQVRLRAEVERFRLGGSEEGGEAARARGIAADRVRAALTGAGPVSTVQVPSGVALRIDGERLVEALTQIVRGLEAFGGPVSIEVTREGAETVVRLDVR